MKTILWWMKNHFFTFCFLTNRNNSLFRKILSSSLVAFLLCSMILFPFIPTVASESLDAKALGGDTDKTTPSSPPVVKTSPDTVTESEKTVSDSGSMVDESDSEESKTSDDDKSGGDDTSDTPNTESGNDVSINDDTSDDVDLNPSNLESVSDNTIEQQTQETSVSYSTKSSITSNEEKQLENTSIQDVLSNNDTSVVKDDEVKSYEFQKSTIEATENMIGNSTDTEVSSVDLKSSIGDVEKGEMVSVKTANQEKETSCIQRIDFKTAQNQKNVILSVSNLAEKPIEIKKELNLSLNDQVYTYLNIKLTANTTYIGETGIDQMIFNFTIEKSWIENQSIDKYQVKMMRYHNDSWQTLNTSYDGESDTIIYYQAETPGLSIFAVVGNKIIEESDDDVVVESSSFPWWMPTGIIIFSTTALGIVLVKKRFVYHA